MIEPTTEYAKESLHETPNYQPKEYDTVVIYHGGCPDGLMAAWTFTQLNEEDQKKYGTIYYHYVFERCFAKDTYMPDLTNKYVFIVDYSYPKDTILEIAEKAKHVTVLDHHETAQKDLSDLCNSCENTISTNYTNYTIVFDMDRCGAEITWEFMFGDKKSAPWWMVHIRDRDLWLWSHPDSQAFGSALSDLGFKFESIDLINSFDALQKEAFIKRGNTIIEFQDREISAISKAAVLVEFEGHMVYAVGSLRYRSEVGNFLAKKPDCMFSLMYNYNLEKNEWWISLRGIKENGLNLSEIAARHGGGGHPLACGFTYKGNLSDILKVIPAKTGFSDE